MSQAPEASRPYLIIESFSQFLVLKVISNRYKFRQSLLVNEIKDINQLFLHELIIKLSQNLPSEKEEIEKALQQEGITIRETKDKLIDLSQVKFQTFDAFCSIVFDSPLQCSLLINDFNLKLPNDSRLQENLFDQSQRYKIRKIEQKVESDNKINWYLIEPNRKQTAQISQQPFFSCQNFIKLGNMLTISIYHLIEASRKYHGLAKATSIAKEYLYDLMSKPAIDISKSLCYCKLGANIRVYLILHINEIKTFAQVVQQLYKGGYGECIDWNLKVNNFMDFELSQLKRVQAILKKRMHDDMEKTSITKWNDVELGLLDLEETPKIRMLPDSLSLNRGYQLPSDKNLSEVLQRIKSSLFSDQDKDHDILKLQDLWQKMSDYFSEILKNWNTHRFWLQSQLKPIVTYLDYRLNKFRIPYSPQLMKKPEQQLSHEEKFELHFNNFFSLCDRLYPRISQFVEQFTRKMHQKPIKQRIREKYLEYLKRIDEKNRAQQKNVKRSQFNESKKLSDHRSNQRQGDIGQESTKDDKNKFNQYINITKQVIEDVKKQLSKDLKIENVLDKLMMDYFAEIDSENHGKGSFYIKIEGFEKKELKEFVGQIISFQQNVFNWQDVFNLITLNLRRSDQKWQEITERLDLSLYSETSCLGCAQFFVLNKSIVSKYNKTPLRIFSDGSISRSKTEIMEEICSMLNKKGGIILFNCVKNYGSVLPKGAYLINGDRRKIIQQIQDMIKLFYPVIQIDKNIFISFVPIFIRNQKKTEKKVFKRYDDPEKQSQYYEGYQPIDGFYIMRIKVVVKDQMQVYFWRQQAQKYVLNGFVNNKKGKIPFKRIRYAIQQKINKYLNSEEFQFRPQTFDNPLDHQCKKTRQQEISQPTLAQERPRQANNYQKMYKYMTLIVVKRQNIPKIINILRNQGHNIHISTYFERYGFGLAKYTAVLHHDPPFPQILTQFANTPQLVFDQKRVLTIFITDYLKIDAPAGLNQTEVQNARQWLKKEFPEEQLNYYKQFNEETNLTTYYIKTKTKLSTLFMYYVFNQYKIKSIFKNPPTANKLEKLE